jgi:acetyl/propionyl-CoA carboxylase alpha subunit
MEGKHMSNIEDPRIFELRKRRQKVHQGGGEKRVQRQHARGKLTARQRYLGDGVVTGYGQIEGRTFDVEVGALNFWPVVTLVDGERFEVWPEDEVKTKSASPHQTESRDSIATVSPILDNAVRSDTQSILAPIPGVIEGMKMKNSIRAARLGVVTEIRVADGQLVKYGDVLVEFE